MPMTARKRALLALLADGGELTVHQLLKHFDPLVTIESLRASLSTMERVDGWICSRFVKREAQMTKLYRLTEAGALAGRQAPVARGTRVVPLEHPPSWDD